MNRHKKNRDEDKGSLPIKCVLIKTIISIKTTISEAIFAHIAAHFFNQ